MTGYGLTSDAASYGEVEPQGRWFEHAVHLAVRDQSRCRFMGSCAVEHLGIDRMPHSR